MGDRLLQHGKRLHLQLKVGFQHLFDRFADAKAAEELEIGEAVKEQDTLRHLVGVLHLVDRFAIFELGELLDAPMLQHSVMEKILVDRRQLVLEDGGQLFDDLGVALNRSQSVQWVESMNNGSGRGNIYRKKRPDIQANDNTTKQILNE